MPVQEVVAVRLIVGDTVTGDRMTSSIGRVMSRSAEDGRCALVSGSGDSWKMFVRERGR